MRPFGALLIVAAVGIAIAAIFFANPSDETHSMVLWWFAAVTLLAGIGCVVGAQEPDGHAAPSEAPHSIQNAAVGVADGVSDGELESSLYEAHTAQETFSISAKTPISLLIGEEHQGPYVLSQIRKMWDSGSITANALYWAEGMEKWEDLVSLLESDAEPTTSAVQNRPVDAPKVIKVTYESRAGAFSGSMPLMVKLAMRAIQDLGWKLENVNDSIGLVTFRTGMSMGSWSGVSCSLNIEEISDGLFRVIGTGNQNISGRQLAALDFGEAQRKAQKAIDRMKVLAA